MNPLRRPRRWVRIAVTVLIGAALWLLLTPITVVYFTTDRDAAPRVVAVLYSWRTSDQEVVYTDGGVDQSRPVQDANLVNGYRLSCGSSFTTGSHEVEHQPDGPQVCSTTEKPRLLVGMSLLLIGVLGLVASTKVPAEPERYRNRYRQTYSQRRILKRGR